MQSPIKNPNLTSSQLDPNPNSSNNSPGADPFRKSMGASKSGWGKKKPNQTGQSQAEPQNPAATMSEVKPNIKEAKAKKQKTFARRNITDGRIHLTINDNDRVFEDYVYDYKENPYEVLDQNPVRVTSYIEELKGGNFKQIYNKAVKGLMEQQSEQAQVPSSVEHLEIDLLELVYSSRSFLGRFFLFFQGLASGLSIINLYLLYLNSDSTQSLSIYSYQALRLNQIFLVVLLLCAIGAIDKSLFLLNKYEEAMRAQKSNLQELRKNYIRTIVASIAFTAGYCMVIFNHEVVSEISVNNGQTAALINLQTNYQSFQVLSGLIALCSFIGWLALVTIQGEVQTTDIRDQLDYSGLTEDDDVRQKDELL